ncbi:AGAP012040-PA-like protein [Anopheles sinensis]|uniref:AGAP012040-PA-like protein n=1 Tax=Anopheles sinensis TaxID=74873 RepID=A0A084VIL0_ANOSI|nr:AGAP012040-PA-like protein [Anopheles sinensis]
MATASNVKLPDLINRWIEVQKKSCSLERTEPLDIDAINLTLLLKSMGLRLQYLDFEADKGSTDNLTVTIKCNRSGMRADLSYELVNCSCPEKTDCESSFWEVQATGPQVFSKFKNNTSSNLLPDVSESCALVSKAMLSNLLDFYQASIRQVKEGKEQAMLHSPLKSPRGKVCVTSPGLTVQSPFSTPPAEGKCLSRIEAGKERGFPNQIDKGPQLDVAECSDKQQQKDAGSKNDPTPGKTASRGSSEGQSEAKSNSSAESVGINNKTHEIAHSECNSEKPVVEAAQSPEHTSVPDEKAYEAMKTLVTSSPNEKRFHSTPTQLDQQHDRDLNVINYLQQARSQIDMALLLMKLNTTQDIADGSAVTITPQHTTAISRKSLITPKFLQPRSSSLLSIERRRPPVDIGAKKKSSSNSSLSSTAKSSISGNSGGRADTPRPSIAQVKSVATLRKTVSMPHSGALGSTGQLPPTASKKSTASTLGTLAAQRKLLQPSTPTSTGRQIPKPPISNRPMSSLASGLIQRSSSASHITKK